MYTICESGANKGHQAHSQESFALRFVYVFFFFNGCLSVYGTNTQVKRAGIASLRV